MTEALNEQVNDQSRPEPSPDEILQRATADFSRNVQETASRFSEAVQTLVSAFGEAIGAFAEEQRGLLHRQQVLRDEGTLFAGLAQSFSEQASNALTASTSSQQRANDLIGVLEEQREELALLIEDLRQRLSALTVLAAPLPVPASRLQPLQREVTSGPCPHS